MTIPYARFALTGLKRDIAGDTADETKVQIEGSAGLELVMGDVVGAFSEANLEYIADAEKITEFAVHAGMIFYFR